MVPVTRGRREILAGFSWGKQKDLGVGGWTVLKWVLNTREGVDRFYLD